MTAPNVADRVLDFGLNVLDNIAENVCLCSAEPTTYLEATSTFNIININVGGGSVATSPVSNGSPQPGRQVTVTGRSGNVTTAGTITHLAIVEFFANQRLLAVFPVVTPKDVAVGMNVSFASFTVKLSKTQF